MRHYLLAAIVCWPLVAFDLVAQETTPKRAEKPAVQQTAVDALRAGDRTAAIQAVDSLLKRDSDDPRVLLLAADVYLRCNLPKRAVPLYDRYIEINPRSMPQLWQRGIALFFIGRHGDAVHQFVEHRRVNPYDVENAAWHFLCLAKAESFEKAKASVLPAPNDPRIPMAEVQEMLLTGKTDLVSERIKAILPNAREYESAMFYGNFYLGLYADAQGDQQTALDKMTLAAKDAPHHYMGDVARVYAEYLRESEASKRSATPTDDRDTP